MTEILTGVCFFHSETGTEGGYWAFQENKFMNLAPPNRHFCETCGRVWDTDGVWAYDGLHILHNGDYLKIFNPEDPTNVVWEGEINLIQHPLFTEHVQDLWIHADQAGIDRETWAEYFLKEYPGELKTI